MKLTDEQRAVVDATLTRQHVIVEAGAGAGKTSTLVACANALPSTTPGLYLSFTRAIVEEASRKFPKNIECSTAHKLARNGIIYSRDPSLARAKECLNKSRNTSRQTAVDVANILGLDPFSFDKDRKLSNSTVAHVVLDTLKNFRQSNRDDISIRDMPYIEGLDVNTDPNAPKRKGSEHQALWRHISEGVSKAWADLTDPYGRLTYSPNDFLKQYQLSHPRIESDIIFFDEAQDANPVMAAILADQLTFENAPQLVLVGDSAQAIYAWNGAVDAIASFKRDFAESQQPHQIRQLSQSWRFGQAIADVANVYLRHISSTTLQMRGNPAIDSKISTEMNNSDQLTIISRTNAGVIDNLMTFLDAEIKTAIVGGRDWTANQISLIRGMEELRVRNHTNHRELCGFADWNAFADYVESDGAGSDLKPTYQLLIHHGSQALIDALGAVTESESNAAVVLSTGHKAKGREWDHVAIDDDFNTDTPLESRSDEALSLLYVVGTRAKDTLEVSSIITDIYSDPEVSRRLHTVSSSIAIS
jgi:hypothetical protein